jgi:serine phosphatase RsbU (regulator of sigma subunit)
MDSSANSDRSALLILGDVSGKGLKAAMTVSLLVGTVRTLAEIFEGPAEILSALNRRMHGRMLNGFVTCLNLPFRGLVRVSNYAFLRAQQNMKD